jgi:antirestriction protein ArdC
MSAALFCQIADLDTSETPQTSTAYILSWIQHLRNNPKWILKASKQTRETLDFVLTGELPEGRGRAAATA